MQSGIFSFFEALRPAVSGFLHVKGHDLVDEKGEKFFIRGTNLGNWLNPEGYMFGFGKCSSPHMIDEMFKQLVGPEETANFWAAFRANYITEPDLAFVARTGANTVRLPFHYKLFTNEEYLGTTDPNEGFRYMDAVVGWCRQYGLKVILDMHDCPGGQTGSNIDDSYGNAWLFESEFFQRQYCDIWRRIAQRYSKEPVVLGYDLMNEPISHELRDKDLYNSRMESVQFRALDAIREVDKKHIIILGGAQWNGNFGVFSDFKKDSNMMYQCHHYDFGNPEYNDGRVQEFAAFRDKSGLPMYMGETGHNPSYDWYRRIRESMEAKNIGWTFWPLKKPDSSSWLTFAFPQGWKETIIAFAEADRSSYGNIYKARPDRATALSLMKEYVENCKAANCNVEASYLDALGLQVPQI